jgi:ATP-dependent Clp protease protease subunit
MKDITFVLFLAIFSVSNGFLFNARSSRNVADVSWSKSQLAMSSPEEPNQPPKRDPAPLSLPTVGLGNDQYDVISRLLKDRILLLGTEVNDDVANIMVSQMLYLAAADPEADITIYINSPGGSVQAGMAIFDTMQYIPCDVNTVCFGMAASMGAFLLSAGTKGKRRSLPNSRIMIHQPLGGSQGEATDLEITAKLMLHTKEVLNTYLAAFCDQPIDKLRSDTERDFYMTPDEALQYGLIDSVIQHGNMIPKPKMSDLKVKAPLSLYDLSTVSKDMPDPTPTKKEDPFSRGWT